MTDASELARGALIALNGNPDPDAGRNHALDNLRAVMMWLGIVFHVASLHLAWEVVRWRAPETTPLANLLAAFIHAFRMPVFFILAGYFVLLLVQRKHSNAGVLDATGRYRTAAGSGRSAVAIPGA